MDDVAARQLALAMAAHPRLGAHSPLALLDAALLATHLGEKTTCAHVRRSPQAVRATQLRAVLRSDVSPIETPRAANSYERYLLRLCPIHDVCTVPGVLRRALLRYGWKARPSKKKTTALKP